MRTSLALLRRILLLGAVVVFVTGTSAAAAASPWQAPLRPMSVTRHFERPPTPYAAGHRGVDLRGIPGEAVFAAGAGEVGYAGVLAGRGVVVVVHGALRTTYEPVRAIVHRGARVRAGEQIADLEPGHPGCPVTACLHWGLLRGDTYLDPLSLLGDQRIRLVAPNGRPDVTGLRVTPALSTGQTASAAGVAGAPSPGLDPGVTWSVAALTGAGVVVVRRRR
ncbi:MAG TPA: peptidoglycan DD-metalloendopeptidase family protein [Frankiaceae bacterium]|nr:peptidoglycan DD-metalloendopeptidase family protein [Frankiaceae bacterium]